MEDKAYLPALQKIEGIGSVTLNALWRELGGVREIWQASMRQFESIKWLPSSLARLIVEGRLKVDPEKEWFKVKELGVELILLDEDEYPKLLRNIHNPPIGFYILGKIPPNETAIAVVGSRRPTPYGVKVSEKLGEELARNGVLVVSGMARGIDTFAHKGALNCDCGSTIAVLGSGLDVIYPPENKHLFREISERGAVISEFPPGTPPYGSNFPQRNRIISGLSWGTIVIEAAEKSGSLITADFAMEQGREVFAVPGPITSLQSKGANRLLKQGAILVQSVSDILDEYTLQPLFTPQTKKTELVLSKEERAVLESLSFEPVSFDAIIEKTELSPAKVSSAVTYLEIKGLASQLPGKRYVSI